MPMLARDIQVNNSKEQKLLLIRNKARQETRKGHLKMLKGKKKVNLKSLYPVKIHFTNESKIFQVNEA